MNHIICIRTLTAMCHVVALAASILASGCSPARAQSPNSAFGNRAQPAMAPIPRPIGQKPAANPRPAISPATGAWKSSKDPTTGAAASRAPSPGMKFRLSSEKLKTHSPRRANLLSAHQALVTGQNSAAQSVRGKALASAVHSSGQAPPANTRRLSSASQVGAFAKPPAAYDPHIMKNAWKPTPGIVMVNGRGRDYPVTPGGFLTIAGNAFGDNAGQVGLFGSMSRNRLELQVVTWSDNEIYALLPAGLRGLPDQAMTLQVITREGKTYVLEGAAFRATREEVAVTTHLDRVFRIETDPHWTAEPGFDSTGGVVVRNLKMYGSDCLAPGTDRIVFLPLPNGFEVTGASMQHGRTDSGDGDGDGNAGSRVFFPGYSFGEWRDETVATDRLRSAVQSVLYVHWGVWRTHTSPYGLLDAEDNCSSMYTITGITAIGPAGVPVF